MWSVQKFSSYWQKMDAEMQYGLHYANMTILHKFY